MHPSDAAPPVSLDDFAPLSTSTCGVCGLPTDLRSEVESARRADERRFTYPVISGWLKTRGRDVSDSSLRRHFKRGHADAGEIA